MASPLIKFCIRILPGLTIVVLLLTSFILMLQATSSSTQFTRYYGPLLAFNGVSLLVLLATIVYRVARLVGQRRRNVPGSRLTFRLLTMLLALALPPVTLVYLFSVYMLNQSVDSWFDVKVDSALTDAIELSRVFLDSRKLDALRSARRIAAHIGHQNGYLLSRTLRAQLIETRAQQLSVIGANGNIIGFVSADTHTTQISIPDEYTVLQALQNKFYAAVEPRADGHLVLRILLTVEPTTKSNITAKRYLHAIYPIDSSINAIADRISAEYEDYRQLVFLRQPLKNSYSIVLFLVLLLSFFLAVLAAFVVTRKTVSPIQRLSLATEEIAAGHYQGQISETSNDELGFLVKSFNAMTRDLSKASQKALDSQQQVEDQRAYLATVLKRLSSGVIALDQSNSLITCNAAADTILNALISASINSPFDEIAENHPQLSPFFDAIAAQRDSGNREWREEIIVQGDKGRIVLMCRGALLEYSNRHQGLVVVFDDMTVLLQAQREAAWGEVAQRLAHEVKNPLTPIQLSAERLRHKYLPTMPAKDAAVLDRATHIIVQQVDALKTMVNAFSDYARPPKLQAKIIDIMPLVQEVTDLYQQETSPARFKFDPQQEPIQLLADPGKLRQLLHNLIKNCMEAVIDGKTITITIAAKRATRSEEHYLILSISDDGPGIPEALLERLFEPYITGKTKGTGLGLAIVKKIVDEHGGYIDAENQADQGAKISIWLPQHTGVK